MDIYYRAFSYFQCRRSALYEIIRNVFTINTLLCNPICARLSWLSLNNSGWFSLNICFKRMDLNKAEWPDGFSDLVSENFSMFYIRGKCQLSVCFCTTLSWICPNMTEWQHAAFEIQSWLFFFFSLFVLSNSSVNTWRFSAITSLSNDKCLHEFVYSICFVWVSQQYSIRLYTLHTEFMAYGIMMVYLPYWLWEGQPLQCTGSTPVVELGLIDLSSLSVHTRNTYRV